MTQDACAIWKKIAEASNCPQHQRLTALRGLDEYAPFVLLQRLIDNPNTPGRLRGLAAEIFVRKTALRQLRKETNVTDDPSTN